MAYVKKKDREYLKKIKSEDIRDATDIELDNRLKEFEKEKISKVTEEFIKTNENIKSLKYEKKLDLEPQINNQKINIKLPKLHNGQQIVLNSKARFKVLCCGRRWGKTMLGAIMCMYYAIKGGRVWWVAPSYKISNIGWRLMKAMAIKLGKDFCVIKEAQKRIEFVGLKNQGWIEVKSADQPDSLRGEGLDFVVCDEFAFFKKGVWAECIRPALSDKMGSALLISTPKGRGEFYNMYEKGKTIEMIKDRNNEEIRQFQSFHFKSTDNPFFPPQELENAKQELPEDTFRQEYLAEFLDGSAGVFRKIDSCIGKVLRTTVGSFIMGVDLARKNDYTVLTVMNTHTGEVIEVDRFNQIDWDYQKRRIITMQQKYNCQIIMDTTGVGDPIYEDLTRSGMPVKSFIFTHESKKKLITDLQLAFERRRIIIPPDELILINELRSYEYELTPSGKITYNAPSGYYDDCVISLALAYSGCNFSYTFSKSRVFLGSSGKFV